MRIGGTWRNVLLSAATCAFLVPCLIGADSTSAQGQGFVGRTMIAHFTIRQSFCQAGSQSCQPLEAVTLNTNIYFGKQGELFDYGQGKTGLRRKFGVTYRETEDNRWDMRGNRIVRTVSVPQFTDIYTYTALGSHCTIGVQRRMKPGSSGHFVMRADVASCQLVEGLRER